MPNFKNGRLSEDIKREISGLIREEIKDPRVNGSLVSVVRTELSGDNSHCKVYISSIEGQDAAKTAVKGLESASGLIKRRISNVLHLKKCPELKFIADDSIEHSAEIAQKLEDLEINKTEGTEDQ
ncbi:MAG: 30S ribosome-binding factor RbfA [Oscillospiraceae bacterium]|nr:30S ribosome-binding factor RbfA [Oscillospiraceae bacterium]